MQIIFHWTTVKLQDYSIHSLSHFSGSYSIPDEALIAETTIWHIFYLINIITVLKETQFHL